MRYGDGDSVGHQMPIYFYFDFVKVFSFIILFIPRALTFFVLKQRK